MNLSVIHETQGPALHEHFSVDFYLPVRLEREITPCPYNDKFTKNQLMTGCVEVFYIGICPMGFCIGQLSTRDSSGVHSRESLPPVSK